MARSSGRARRVAMGLGATLVLTLVGGEVAVRATGKYATYSEKNFDKYVSVLGATKETWFQDRPPSSHEMHVTADFAIATDTNREGVRDVEHDPANPDKKWRVVVLGDSYTEGVGVEFPESWPQVLASSLASQGIDVQLLQAGVSGSDPFFEYKLLEQRFLHYHPDLVLFMLNKSDVCDTWWWGGLERFQADGKTHARPAPWFEPLYHHSHLARFLVHLTHDWRLVPFAQLARVETEIEQKILDLMVRVRDLGNQEGFKVWVGVHLVPDELYYDAMPFQIGFFKGLQEAGIPFGSLARVMRDELKDLPAAEVSWPTDRHYKARGYAVMAAGVEASLKKWNLLPAPSAVGATAPETR